MNTKTWWAALVGVSLLLLATTALHAQRPERGFMRGGPPMRGRPPMRGGPSARGGSFSGPMSFLQRMDTNHNGMLDPSETQGRARGFLERIAQEAKLDLNRPIKLEKIAKAFEKMRERRMKDMSRGGSSDRRSSGSDRRGSSSRGTTETEPLVPGFGEPEMYDPVPGFGTVGEQFAVKIEDSDRREAERTLRRYDENHDGVLDKKETSRGRWSEDPFKTDRNHDGKLSLNELALRYAVRRAAREGGSSKRASSRSSSSRRSSSSSSRSSSRSSSSSNSRTEMIARMMMSRYDRNKDGVLDKDEWKQSRTDPSAADTNHDRKITTSELAKWIASRMGSRGGSDRGSSGRSRWYSRRQSADSSARGGSSRGSVDSKESANEGGWARLHSPTELLPEGLPEWFAQRDANGDGQVMMHEFATSWSPSVAADFTQFDLNGDGVITPQECLRATEAGAVLGSAPSTALTSSSTPRTSTSSTTTGTAAASTTSASTAKPSLKKNLSKAVRRYIKYAVGYIKRYDTNHDGVLVKEEWTKMSKDYSPADTDGDGKITPTELAEYMMKQWK